MDIDFSYLENEITLPRYLGIALRAAQSHGSECGGKIANFDPTQVFHQISKKWKQTCRIILSSVRVVGSRIWACHPMSAWQILENVAESKTAYCKRNRLETYLSESMIEINCPCTEKSWITMQKYKKKTRKKTIAILTPPMMKKVHMMSVVSLHLITLPMKQCSKKHRTVHRSETPKNVKY